MDGSLIFVGEIWGCSAAGDGGSVSNQAVIPMIRPEGTAVKKRLFLENTLRSFTESSHQSA